MDVSSNPNGGSKSCDDLLDTAESGSAIYAEIPTPSIGATSFSGAVPTPYCTISELFQKPEETHPGAKSILLTEDNLVPNIPNLECSENDYTLRRGPRPDLIQNLPLTHAIRQVTSTYVSKSFSVLRAEDNYSDYDYIDDYKESNIASAMGFKNHLLNYNGMDTEGHYSSINR